MAKKQLRKLPKQLMSKKIISLIIDDFSFFGSFAFLFFVIAFAYFTKNTELFYRLSYFLLIGILVLIAIKSIHYKDRPQKEEFGIFMEKMIASSFPSSHSMVTTAITILIYLAYPLQWVLYLFSFASIIVYIQRYITKKHFFIDIVGGILTAVAVCIFVIRVL